MNKTSYSKVSGGIDIVFKNIKFEVLEKKTGKFKTILKGVSGQIKAGQSCALMGASGAGKSTLLNILSGRIKPSPNNRLTGDVFYNGKKYSATEISSFSGYVLQQDILIEYLTVQGIKNFLNF
jgi:ABC-type multidrug transport system ATPase subunit